MGSQRPHRPQSGLCRRALVSALVARILMRVSFVDTNASPTRPWGKFFLSLPCSARLSSKASPAQVEGGSMPTSFATTSTPPGAPPFPNRSHFFGGKITT